ncbi:MAG: glycosyltransferase [Terriglobia bacterium]
MAGEADLRDRAANAPSCAPELPPGVLFHASIYGASGYAEENWMEVLGLEQHGIPVQLAPIGSQRDTTKLLPSAVRHKLAELQQNRVDLGRGVYYQCVPAGDLDLDTYGRYRVARTTFETERIPEGWAERCNAMDQVWVPSTFNVKSFVESGVEEQKLRIIPGGMDTRLFRPGLKPFRIPKKRGFTFLSVFDWQDRKGYDVLFRAFLNEFRPDEDVTLLIKLYQINDPFTDVEAKVLYFIERELGMPLERTPPIVLLNGVIPQQQMPRLYCSADAFVLPSRGEGWGRPYLEALCCGLPVIGTRWGGQTDYLNDENSYLVEIEGVMAVSPDVDIEVLAGQRWAAPSVDHLRKQMRRVFSQRHEARARAARGRQEVIERLDWRVIIPRWVELFRNLLD